MFNGFDILKPEFCTIFQHNKALVHDKPPVQHPLRRDTDSPAVCMLPSLLRRNDGFVPGIVDAGLMLTLRRR